MTTTPAGSAGAVDHRCVESLVQRSEQSYIDDEIGNLVEQVTKIIGLSQSEEAQFRERLAKIAVAGRDSDASDELCDCANLVQFRFDGDPQHELEQIVGPLRAKVFHDVQGDIEENERYDVAERYIFKVWRKLNLSRDEVAKLEAILKEAQSKKFDDDDIIEKRIDLQKQFISERIKATLTRAKWLACLEIGVPYLWDTSDND